MKASPSKALCSAADCGDPGEVLNALRALPREELQTRPLTLGKAIGAVLNRARLSWRPLGQVLSSFMDGLSGEKIPEDFLRGLVDSDGPAGLAKAICDHHVYSPLRPQALDWLVDHPLLTESLSTSDKQAFLRQSEVLNTFAANTKFFLLVLSQHFDGITTPLQAIDSALCRLKPSINLVSLVHLLLLRSRRISWSAELPSKVCSLLGRYARKSGGLWLTLIVGTWRYRSVDADLLWAACRHYHHHRAKLSSQQHPADVIADRLVPCTEEDIFNGLYRSLVKVVRGEHSPPPQECWIGTINVVINSTVAVAEQFATVCELLDSDRSSWLREAIRAHPCIERVLVDDLKAIELVHKVGLRREVLAYSTAAIVYGYQRQHWQFLRSLLASYPNQVVSELTPLRVLRRPMDEQFRSEFLAAMKARPGLWDPYAGYDLSDDTTDSDSEQHEDVQSRRGGSPEDDATSFRFSPVSDEELLESADFRRLARAISTAASAAWRHES
ncbi:hypothetical protein FOZ63_007381 [Perkinsus olseni]|uniref:Uncharacterized protein n=1 Tax=Perkinsus olseni TaxID=32597 RepID=A0A7J6NFW5_PEROL|nr:hypothetical protein FOZ60_011352 [Perkinsus olseni]KAF4706620.1 hypothetical protein FOZ62_011298 [Perkinsus olseni]KAF4716248.1 hypothetical protein FOZ63_007381 [Perkinsus olseni]